MSMALKLLAYACNVPATDGDDVCDQGSAISSKQAEAKSGLHRRSHDHNRV